MHRTGGPLGPPCCCWNAAPGRGNISMHSLARAMRGAMWEAIRLTICATQALQEPCRCMPVYAKGTQRSSHKQLLACKAAPLLLARRAGSRRAPAAAWTAARPSGWPRLGRPRQMRCRPSPAATPSSTSRPPPPHCPAGAASRAPRRPSPAGRFLAHMFRAGRSSVRITSRARTVKTVEMREEQLCLDGAIGESERWRHAGPPCQHAIFDRPGKRTSCTGYNPKSCAPEPAPHAARQPLRASRPP